MACRPEGKGLNAPKMENIRDEIAKRSAHPLMVEFGHMALAVVQEELCKDKRCEVLCKVAQLKWYYYYLLAWQGYTTLN